MPETAGFSPGGPNPWENQSLVEGLTKEDIDAAADAFSGKNRVETNPDAAESKPPFEDMSGASTGKKEKNPLLDPLLQAELYAKEQKKINKVRDMIKDLPDSGEPIVAESTPPADRGDDPIRNGQPSIIVEGAPAREEHTGLIDTTAIERTEPEVTQEEVTVSGVEGQDEETIDINPETAESTLEETPTDLERTLENIPTGASSLSPEEIAARLPEEGGDEEYPTIRQ